MKKGQITNETKAREILRKPYSRVIVPEEDGNGFNAEIPEFPGCFASGDTLAEAAESLERAAIGWVMACLNQSKEIPRPIERESSGKFLLRMPRTIHARAAQLAALDGVSLNQFFNCAIAERIGMQTASSAQTTHRVAIINTMIQVGSTPSLQRLEGHPFQFTSGIQMSPITSVQPAPMAMEVGVHAGG